MNKIKPIALAFSDFHTAKWKQFNQDHSRTLQPFDIMSRLRKACVKYKVNTLLFAGDWNDHPKHVDNEVLQVWSEINMGLEVKDLLIVGIEGNHDFDKINTIRKNISGFFSHLTSFSKHFICVNYKYYDTKAFRIHGIPYINGNADYKKALKERVKNITKDKPNILMVHRDLPGALEPNGMSIGQMEDSKVLKKYFAKFDLVLAGHIHKPQRIKGLGKHVYMLGATNQQRRSDAGTKMGYWIIYSDMSMKFVDLKQPEFRYHKHNEEPTNTTDYWIRLPAPATGNTNNSNDGKGNFNVHQKRDKLVKNYLRVKGIKNKKKLTLLMDLIND